MEATYLAGLLGATALGVTVGLGVSSQPAQETQTETTRGTQEAATDEIDPMMAAMMRAGAINENHEMLTTMIGEFDVKTTFINNGETENNTGNWVAEWSMGGRFVEGTFTMDWQGMPFEGRQIVGYSNLDQAFKAIWFDNSSTNLSYSAGFASEDGQRITFLGSDPDMMTGEIQENEAVLEFTDENNFSYTNYLVNDGQRGEMNMKIEYTRR